MSTIMDLDSTRPDIPKSIFPEPLSDWSIVEDLWAQVWNEVQQPEFANRSHGTVGTYQAGCHGILCRRSHGEHRLRRRGSFLNQGTSLESYYDPIAEFFGIVAKYRIRAYKRHLLDRIKAG